MAVWLLDQQPVGGSAGGSGSSDGKLASFRGASEQLTTRTCP